MRCCRIVCTVMLFFCIFLLLLFRISGDLRRIKEGVEKCIAGV